MITVFTPTYNRKDELELLYKSLLQQKNSNFEWLIVDDGSNDDTQKYIKNLEKDSKIKITYYYKENGGKQSAYNLGLEKAKGNVFLCIDSDDCFIPNSLEKIEKDFENIFNDNSVCGIMYLQSYKNKKEVIGTKFPENCIDTYYNIYNKYSVKGDKMIVFKTSIAKQYPFPIVDKEKFIPEALVYNRISKKYKFLCKNTIVAKKEYLDNGYSNNYFSLVKRNSKGNSLYYKELYDFNKSFYNVYGYILFSIFAKEKFVNIIKNHPAKIKIILIYLPTLLISIIRR